MTVAKLLRPSPASLLVTMIPLLVLVSLLGYAQRGMRLCRSAERGLSSHIDRSAAAAARTVQPGS